MTERFTKVSVIEQGASALYSGLRARVKPLGIARVFPSLVCITLVVFIYDYLVSQFLSPI